MIADYIELETGIYIPEVSVDEKGNVKKLNPIRYKNRLKKAMKYMNDEKVFNKLVRDKIPDIIENNNEVAITRILNADEYRNELYKKLIEEANEVISSKTTKETLEELADVLEVINAISKLESKNLDDIIEISNQKRLKRGGFEKRIFLEKTYKK